MNRSTAGVSMDVSMTFEPEPGLVRHLSTVFGYRQSDPYAVSLRFLAGAGAPVWVFGRELLAQGLGEPAGVGDVQIVPGTDESGRGVVDIVLSSPDGEFMGTVFADDVSRFLTRTESVVALGREAEYLDLDGLLDLLLTAA